MTDSADIARWWASVRAHPPAEWSPMPPRMTRSTITPNSETRQGWTMPERIQLRRTKGWRKPEGAIVVSRPSRWGNPWRITPGYRGWFAVERDNGDSLGQFATADEAAYWAVLAFRRDMTDTERELARKRLASHDLACWCPLDQPCHADVLLEVANA